MFQAVYPIRVRLVIGLVFVVGFVVPVVGASALSSLSGHLTPIGPEVIAAFFASVLSLAATYVPGVREWYAGLSADYKQLIMLGGLFGVTVAVFVSGCFPVLGYAVVECSAAGAVSIFQVFIVALIANQTTDRIMPKPSSVKAAKLNHRMSQNSAKAA